MNNLTATPTDLVFTVHNFSILVEFLLTVEHLAAKEPDMFSQEVEETKTELKEV